MWLLVTLLGLFLLPVRVVPEILVQKKAGEEVLLAPNLASMTVPITVISWKHGPDLAIEWDGQNIPDSYRHFKDRGSLNIKTGELTITGLTPEDSGSYTVEINNKLTSTTRLQVILPVSKPTISISCDADMTRCLLTCNVDASHGEPLTYSWTSSGVALENAAKEYVITKEASSEKTEFSCEVMNPVSQESSESIANPLIKRNMKLMTGIMVFISMVTAVVVLIAIHRWKTGVWFYQKGSMPWETDFWRKQQASGREAADAKDANGEPGERDLMASNQPERVEASPT
ncbi:hypothetical protein LDENG_00218520 [Lucifuga dentata]|nr:hypothetical protein LDENG_00218520 [Lucifuga dentata]